jgi:hypothetical protein
VTKDLRAEAIRQRFKARYGAFSYQPSGKPLRAATPARQPKPISDPYETGTAIGKSFEWIYCPNPKPDPSPKPDRRRKGDSALTRIAKRWDERKLIPAKYRKAKR